MKIAGAALMTEKFEFRTLLRRGRFGAYTDLNAARRELAEVPDMPRGDFGDFGRGGMTVRRVTLTALLTAWDAGGDHFDDAGVIGWNGAGCAAETSNYWRDDLANGREAGRGGLFVATLPTIPYCEAAITLGCRGRVAYFRTAPSTRRLRELLAAVPAGRYLCGEVSAATVAMVLADTRCPGSPLPDCPDLCGLFRVLEAEA